MCGTVTWLLTKSLLVEAGDAPTELPVSSLTSFDSGFEKDLKISEYSRFKGANFEAGLCSNSLLSVGGVDVADTPLEESCSG